MPYTGPTTQSNQLWDFLQTNPQTLDWIGGGITGLNRYRAATPNSNLLSEMMKNLGYSYAGPALALGTPAAWQGYANLNQILQSQGKTDPAMMNMMLGGIQRDTQTQQQQAQGALARQGMANSGVGQAIQASIGQAGAQQKAQTRAQEAQLAEERRRQDLNLLLSLIVQPGLDASAMALGQYQANKQSETQLKSAKMSAIAQLFGGLAGLCWASEVIFHNPQDEDAVRAYLATRPELLAAYQVAGRDLAYTIEHEESVRRLVVPKFHEFADIGYELIG